MSIDYDVLFPKEYRLKHKQRCDAITKAHTSDSADEAWHTRRSTGLGGSELGAVLGLSTYQTPASVWRLKTGRAEKFKGNSYTYLGHLLEPNVAQEFSRVTGMPVKVCSQHFRHKELPFLVGNVDRIIIGEDKKRKAILECKTAQVFSASKFSRDAAWYIDGEFKPSKVYVTSIHDVPPSYYIQCQHYMLITGLHECYLAVLIVNGDFRIYCIKYSEQDAEIMMTAAADFWCHNVLDDVEPTLKASDLLLQTSESAGTTVVSSDNGIYKHLADYQQACEEEKAIKEKKELISECIISCIGKSTIMTDAQGNKLVTLKAGNHSVTDTAGMKAEAPELVAKYEELKAKYTAKIPNEKRTLKVY